MDISDRHAHLRPAVARADGGNDRDAFSTSPAEATTLLATSERRLSLLVSPDAIRRTPQETAAGGTGKGQI
jgi:hypothetical protein